MTTKKEAFDAFQARQIQPDYDFDSLTAEEKLDEMYEYTRLKIEYAKEEAELKAQIQSEAEQAQVDRRQLIIDDMVANGYSGEATEADWIKMFNRPEVFGANWETLADEHKGNGLDDFIRFYLRYR